MCNNIGNDMMNMVYVNCPMCGKNNENNIAYGPDFEYRISDDTFKIVECTECGVYYLNPRPHISEMSKIYPSSYMPYNFNKKLGLITLKAREMLLKMRIERIRKLLGENANILDAGCGDGSFAVLLKRYGPSGWNIAGLDIGDLAEENLKKEEMKFYNGRYEDIEFGDCKWDMIIMKDVVEHLESPGTVLAKAYNDLKEGGFLLVETPDFRGWDAILFKDRYWGGWHFPRHWTIYSHNSLSKHLTEKGFIVKSIKPTLSPNFWILSFHHMLSEHKVFKHISGWFDVKYTLPAIFFSVVDLIQICLTGKTSNMQLLAFKHSGQVKEAC